MGATAVRLVGAVIALTFVPLPAQAHTWTELNDYLADWNHRVDLAFIGSIQDDFTSPFLVVDLLAEHRDMRFRHPGWNGLHLSGPIPVAHTWAVYQGAGVERWRDLVAEYFRPGDVNRALCLMRYESGGVPSARNPSGASGLMQIMPFWAPHFGVSAQDLFDPGTNIRLAASIRDSQGWVAWSPYKRGRCR